MEKRSTGMSRLKPKVLKKVSLGPLTSDRPERFSVTIDKPIANVEEGALLDPRLGAIRENGQSISALDYAGAFGTMGRIQLYTYMLLPAFDAPMISFLRLFNYECVNNRVRLVLKDTIRDLIKKNATQPGHRRLKAISEETGPREWFIFPDQGGVRYKQNKSKSSGVQITAEFSGVQLREILLRVVADYRDTIIECGIELANANPADFVRNEVYVMPNIMRMANVFPGNTNVGNHPYTDAYIEIIKANQNRNIKEVRAAYLKLIDRGVGNEGKSLKSDVFTSSKEGFIRGHMYSKVGGQIGRSVVTPDPLILPTQIGIPASLSKDISFRMEVTNENKAEIVRLIMDGHITHVFNIREKVYIRVDKRVTFDLIPGQMLVLRELQNGDVVLGNRQPTLHKNSILAFEVILHEGDTIKIHPSIAPSLN